MRGGQRSLGWEMRSMRISLPGKVKFGGWAGWTSTSPRRAPPWNTADFAAAELIAAVGLAAGDVGEYSGENGGGGGGSGSLPTLVVAKEVQKMGADGVRGLYRHLFPGMASIFVTITMLPHNRK